MTDETESNATALANTGARGTRPQTQSASQMQVAKQTGKQTPMDGATHRSSFSRKTTGLGSRMAAAKRPFASSQLYGERTLRPGTLEYHAAKHCECWAPTPAAAPFGPRKTIGTFD